MVADGICASIVGAVHPLPDHLCATGASSVAGLPLKKTGEVPSTATAKPNVYVPGAVGAVIPTFTSSDCPGASVTGRGAATGLPGPWLLPVLVCVAATVTPAVPCAENVACRYSPAKYVPPPHWQPTPNWRE